MRPVRIAVVGAGLVGRRHAEVLTRSHGAGLAALVDPRPEIGDLAAGLGVSWVPSLEQLDHDRIDGLVLATPNAHHLEGALHAIAAGLPALVEKPLATSVPEALRIVEAGEAAGVPVLVGHHRRYSPLVAEAHRLIRSGALGRTVVVHADFWVEKPAGYFDLDWRREPGGGPVLINLIHDADLLRYLIGEVAAVQAAGSNAVRGFPVEDSAVVLLEFTNGALGTVTLSDCVPSPWSWELTSGENRAYPQTGASCTRIGGTKASLELPQLRLWRSDGQDGWWSPLTATIAPFPSGDPLALQMEHFARVIRGEEEPLVSAREGMMTLRLVEAIASAAATRTRIVLDERLPQSEALREAAIP